MTRPAIVIGLGGSGQWVLTFLKKELLEIGGGTLPSGVKLLSFDTTTRTTAGTGQASKRDKEEDIQYKIKKERENIIINRLIENKFGTSQRLSQFYYTMRRRKSLC